MNYYDYPMPAGLEVVATAQDLGRLQPFAPTKTPFGTQLQTVELVARALRDRALFVDTVFNAWNTLKRNLVREAMPGLMAEQPQAVEAALRIVNDNLIRYAQASLERGAAGIFLRRRPPRKRDSSSTRRCGPSTRPSSRPSAGVASATCPRPR
jgi:hypothetical protein